MHSGSSRQKTTCFCSEAQLLPYAGKCSVIIPSSLQKKFRKVRLCIHISTGHVYQIVTCLQVPGGARVPLLFTIKELQASGDLAKFGGTFKVPSYRGFSFLDPKVSHEPHQAHLGPGMAGSYDCPD